MVVWFKQIFNHSNDLLKIEFWFWWIFSFGIMGYCWFRVWYWAFGYTTSVCIISVPSGDTRCFSRRCIALCEATFINDLWTDWNQGTLSHDFFSQFIRLWSALYNMFQLIQFFGDLSCCHCCIINLKFFVNGWIGACQFRANIPEVSRK